MHILHTLFTRHLGGLEQAFINDTEALVARGHKVTALLRADAPYGEEVATHAASVQTVSPNGFYDILAIWKIRTLLKQIKPDVIVAHNGRAIALLAYAAWGLHIPLCGVSHSYKTARAFHCDMLVVLSEHMRNHFISVGYTKPMSVIPNLMHLPPRPEITKPGNPIVIGAIGRLSEEKGFADFLHALYELKQAGVPFIARIGGDGPEMQRLKLLERKYELNAHIQWAGWVTDKASFYREVDVICLPSREDSFPMVVIETLAYGVPMVATDAPGPVSMLTDGVNGLLVPRRDTSAMAKALQRLATEPELAVKLAEAGWEKAQDFAFDTVAKRWDETLTNFIAPARKRQTA